MIPRVPGDRPRDLSKPLEEIRARVYHELEGLRLDQALRRLMPWRSRSSLQRLIRDGCVAIEPESGTDPSRATDPARSAQKVRPNDIVVVRVPQRLLPPDPSDFADVPELDIVFEDRWLVALDKPAGLTVHPTGRRLSGTLINLLHERYRDEDHAHDVVPRLCHRLDRETSGLILVAKDEWTHAEVRKQFEAHAVEKSYLAVVEGEVTAADGWIDARLGPDSRSRVRLKMATREDGLEALTHWQLRTRASGLSLVEAFPRTGRQHQIRVHFASIGHPIVGDKLYGPDESWFLDAIDGTLSDEARARLRLPRQALHSHTLRLEHPRTRAPLELTADLPGDMAALL